MDGRHTPALLGSEEVAYQARKQENDQCSVFLTDRNGLTLAITSPVAGKYHDLHNMENKPEELFTGLEKAYIPIDGLFINADSGFDSECFRNTCLKHGVTVNVDFNPGNGDVHDDFLPDDLLYKERSGIERTNAWTDCFRTLLNRFDIITSSWKSLNCIDFIVIFLKKITKNKKFRGLQCLICQLVSGRDTSVVLLWVTTILSSFDNSKYFFKLSLNFVVLITRMVLSYYFL